MTPAWARTDTPHRRAAVLVVIAALLLNIVAMHAQLSFHPPEVHAPVVATTAAADATTAGAGNEASIGTPAPRDHNGCLFMGPLCAFGFASDSIMSAAAAAAPITVVALLDAVVPAPGIPVSAVPPPLPPPLYALSALLL